MMNSCCLQGRIGNDIELKKTPTTGKSVLTARIAVQRDTSKYAEEDNVDWITCVLWDKNAELVSQYCKKGDMIGVVGRLQTRRYEDTKKVDRIINEVFVEHVYFWNVSGGKSSQGQSSGGDPTTTRRRRRSDPVDVRFTEEPDDGELPF